MSAGGKVARNVEIGRVRADIQHDVQAAGPLRRADVPQQPQSSTFGDESHDDDRVPPDDDCVSLRWTL
ncbi:CRISPR-associated protein Cas2 [Anopheles sinensis]|uniref:CRISPR-associated protein Cas2 n=1 Tax=Anopheles sinensis TaxID=74873 RepID=A0A084WL46_ANOSI|nr:CRISPR-associated protein Cas2 [Anopheles sinensis]